MAETPVNAERRDAESKEATAARPATRRNGAAEMYMTLEHRDENVIDRMSRAYRMREI
jgi:hypothetical protein